MSANLLALGRKMGLENVSQMKTLIKGVKSGNNGTFTAHLKTNDEIIDSFSKEMNSEAAEISEIVNKYFPKTITSGVENFMDIVVKRFGKNSGAIELSSVAKNADEVLITSKMKSLFNNYGMRLIGEGNAEKSTNLKLDAFIKYNAGSFNQNDAKKILDGIDYQEADGISKLSIKAKDAGAIRKLDVNMEIPSGYVNDLTKTFTKSLKGDGQDFSQIINMAKNA